MLARLLVRILHVPNRIANLNGGAEPQARGIAEAVVGFRRLAATCPPKYGLVRGHKAEESLHVRF
jgi:hypothetical protein